MEGAATISIKKGNKSNFSIDSLLDEAVGKVGNGASSSGDRPPASLFRPQGAAKISFVEGVRSPFFCPLSPHFALSRWPLLQPPPPPGLNLAAVAPIWAMAAGMGAAMFPASRTVGSGQSADPRRLATANKPPPVKKYKCDVCSKAFSRSNTLVTHKRIHSGEKPFSCEHCGRAFRQPGNLTRHRLTHTTVKPYVCSQCGKAFNRASNLHTHMRTHSDYPPHPCPFCSKSFHHKGDAKMHTYTHAGDRSFRCTCEKGFGLSTTLSAHRRPHCNTSTESSTKGPSYSCELCGKQFPQRVSLKNHIQSSHPCKTGDNGCVL